MKRYTSGSIEINGKEFEAEVDYEVVGGRVTVHEVRAVKVLAAKDTDVWYDRGGKEHYGRKILSLDVTDFVSKSAWEEEIEAYLGFMNARHRWHRVSRMAA